MQPFERLKVIRLHLNLDQIVFASELGLKQGSYSDIERGKTASISESVIKLLEYKYNVNRLWLLAGEGKMLKEYNDDVHYPNIEIDSIITFNKKLIEEIEIYKDLVQSQKETILSKNEIIQSKEQMIELLKEKISSLEEEVVGAVAAKSTG